MCVPLRGNSPVWTSTLPVCYDQCKTTLQASPRTHTLFCGCLLADALHLRVVMLCPVTSEGLQDLARRYQSSACNSLLMRRCWLLSLPPQDRQPTKVGEGVGFGLSHGPQAPTGSESHSTEKQGPMVSWMGETPTGSVLNLSLYKPRRQKAGRAHGRIHSASQHLRKLIPSSGPSTRGLTKRYIVPV